MHAVRSHHHSALFCAPSGATMVRADLRGSSADSLVFRHKQEVPYDLQVHKKYKTNSIRRWISSAVKGRRKEKESGGGGVGGEDSPPRQYLEESLLQNQLHPVYVDWAQLVELPPGLDAREWLATHALSFFEHVNLVYGAVSEFCTAASCPAMTGPSNTHYIWEDSRGKKCKYPAPQYVDYVMTFSQTYLQNEAVFPTKYGTGFPPEFESIVKKIQRLLFHVLGHVYHAHYKHVLLLKLHAHLNTLLLHFLSFSHRYSLLADFRETDALNELHDKLLTVCQSRTSTPNSTPTSTPTSPPPSSQCGPFLQTDCSLLDMVEDGGGGGGGGGGGEMLEENKENIVLVS